MAIQFPKNATFRGIAIDGEYTYDGLAFSPHNAAAGGDVFMVLSAPADRVMVIVLSFDDLRKLIELTESEVKP